MDRDLLRCVLPPLLALGIVMALAHPLGSTGDEDATQGPEIASTDSTGAVSTQVRP
jgi:hypothetical protein